MMKELTLEQIKQRSLSVLCMVRDVCRENGLRYSLTGGTLIGAVRHQGFIPWDDDIDIMMPRPDYERLIRLVGAGDYGFDLHCAQLDGADYGYPFAKACCRGTRVAENATRQGGVPIGVFVDIFPVDGAGKRQWSAKLRARLFVALHGLKLCCNWDGFQPSKLRAWYYEPLRYGCYLLSKVLGRRRIDAMMDRFLRARPYADCPWAGRLVGDYGAKEVMPRTLFESTVDVRFEGETFAAVADYDRFLTALYGDYMRLPPAEKQVSHHNFTAYWVE